ncbi:HAMP domain-containing sensor histidine kinase [Erysipelothrix rhusiopathiae]|uniref:sensor histidine kinase n=1 Tax=Erysipelothrix rhusiopathiae TaxID=1648 RepID=UPI002B246A3F|nr:HAMP domain-containing sensor histidine kinase [Erysipelothrix rhusiopathiae]WRB93106.1 HAMP domain-containing sensor histidine kinase [Erysipelothrix rhusiopathiae]
MMRNIREFIRKLSLTQQLIAIVVFTFAFFLVFFFGALSLNIDKFVDKQMYDLIHRTQQNVIYNYKRGLDDVDLYGANDPNIIHVIRNKDGSIKSNGLSLINVDLLKQVKIQMDAVELEQSINYRFKDSSLYTITNIPDKQASIATLISRNYQNEFKSLLLNNVINTILIIIGVVFLLLLVWVSYIIHPLNQIRAYIEKIKRNEDAELNIERHDEIGELADVLVEMNEELKRQERVKEEMIQNISHDLKTPIATIKSYSEAIKDGVYPYETLEKSVDVIIQHADRLEKKVYNLLMLNRMDYMTHEQIDQNSNIELRETIESVIVSSSQIRPEIELILNAEEHNVFFGTEEPWRVVVENLLDNALRYAKTKIIITLKDNYVSVYNDGSTINENRTEKIFNAYEKGEGGQFGLGLSIVNKVATNYGYTVSASNVDEGVIFEIRKAGI